MKIRVFSIFFAFCFLLCGCTVKQDSTKTAIYFDTAVTLTVFGGKIPDEAFELCEKYEKLFSSTDEASELARLNAADGNFAVSDDTAALLEKALDFCAEADGVLDITVYPLKQLWGFGTDSAALPDSANIEKVLKKVDYRKVKIEGNTVTKPQGVKIDLGAVAKGYIADRLAEIWRKNGLSGIIDLGGNILTVGDKKDRSDYKIGIKSPNDESKNAAVLKFSGGAVVTSGSYQRYFTENGKCYHHILSPKTGYPAESGVTSVTVISSSALTADAYSTALFCMGEKAAVEFCRTRNAEAVIIRNDGSIALTDGLQMAGDEITFKVAN